MLLAGEVTATALLSLWPHLRDLNTLRSVYCATDTILINNTIASRPRKICESYARRLADKGANWRTVQSCHPHGDVRGFVNHSRIRTDYVTDGDVLHWTWTLVLRLFCFTVCDIVFACNCNTDIT